MTSRPKIPELDPTPTEEDAALSSLLRNPSRVPHEFMITKTSARDAVAAHRVAIAFSVLRQAAAMVSCRWCATGDVPEMYFKDWCHLTEKGDFVCPRTSFLEALGDIKRPESGETGKGGQG